MGDPRKQRKKYEPPMHPWKAERIIEESGIEKEYDYEKQDRSMENEIHNEKNKNTGKSPYY